jgi:tungstate transport system ATP-binding protein
MTAPLLSGEAITVRRGGRIVLDRSSVEVGAGEVVGIFGPNGAGKSTFVAALAGFLPLRGGRVRLGGQTVGAELPVRMYHRRIAAVFQDPLLLRGTVLHNVALGLTLRGVAATEARARALPWLERLKIAHLGDRDVRRLSGGEAQRTALARALVLDPDVLFLDEPFAAMDAPTRWRLVDELAAILAERKRATLFVTHELGEAFELCDRCLVQDRGEVVQEGPLDQILRQPRSRRVAEITGCENVFGALVAASSPAGVTLEWQGRRMLVRGANAPLGPVTFGVRPEDVRLAASEPDLTGRVARVRRRGRDTLLVVEVGEGSLQVLSA